MSSCFDSFCSFSTSQKGNSIHFLNKKFFQKNPTRISGVSKRNVLNTHLYVGLGRSAELSLDSQVPFLGLERSSFHPVAQNAPLGAALVWAGVGRVLNRLVVFCLTFGATSCLPTNSDWWHVSGVRGHKPAWMDIQWQTHGQAILLAWQPQSIPVQSPTAAPVVMSLLGSLSPSMVLTTSHCAPGAPVL